METNHRFYPLVREFRRTLRAQNKAHRTIGNHLESVELFVAWLDQQSVPPDDWDEVDSTHVKMWLAELLDKHKPSTVATRYAQLRQWFNFLVGEEIIDVHPMADMKPPHVPGVLLLGIGFVLDRPAVITQLDQVGTLLAVDASCLQVGRNIVQKPFAFAAKRQYGCGSLPHVAGWPHRIFDSMSDRGSHAHWPSASVGFQCCPAERSNIRV
ncbi:site-specific integrase [Saccharomonospora sp. NPDC046836]|uniref:site-specific integrase n=1 Tax=Saccharomonospora sp. NPDC046836 TaxID=3156921 RepID=UPI0033DFBBCA